MKWLVIAICSAAAMPPLLACDAAPVIELPATGTSDRFAVMLTGDGGWRRIDDKVTEKLRLEGIPIVGLDVPNYFRTRRTPEESACALEQIIRTYKERWHKDKVILIGYSRGADVLPFMASRLSSDVRGSVQLIALLGLEPLIDFKFHPWWDIGRYFHREQQFRVLPEVQRLAGQNVLCVYGNAEKHTLCTQLDPSHFKIVVQPGSHHFGGHYDEVAQAILDAARD
jgi:type IV secretory pathway VirJ component